MLPCMQATLWVVSTVASIVSETMTLIVRSHFSRDQNGVCWFPFTSKAEKFAGSSLPNVPVDFHDSLGYTWSWITCVIITEYVFISLCSDDVKIKEAVSFKVTYIHTCFLTSFQSFSYWTWSIQLTFLKCFPSLQEDYWGVIQMY